MQEYVTDLSSGSIFQSFTGIKIRHCNKSSYSRQNPLQSSRSRLLTCPRNGCLLGFQQSFAWPSASEPEIIFMANMTSEKTTFCSLCKLILFSVEVHLCLVDEGCLTVVIGSLLLNFCVTDLKRIQTPYELFWDFCTDKTRLSGGRVQV